MNSMRTHWQTLVSRLVVLGGVGAAVLAFAGGCETGGNKGDRCNPLVQRDECDNGLHCQAATCSESYCCPTHGASTDPHCHAEGCPDPDAGAGAGSDDAEAGTAETGSAAPGDAAADIASDARAH